MSLVLVLAAACSQLGMDGGGASGGASAGRQDVRLMENIAQANLTEIETGTPRASRASH
jgi:hypothetical protein